MKFKQKYRFDLEIVVALATLMLNSGVLGHQSSAKSSAKTSLLSGEVPVDLARRGRSARLGHLWTKNEGHGIIFVLSKKFRPNEEARIADAAHEIRKHSCILVTIIRESEFEVEREKHKRQFENYVFIGRTRDLCKADVGMEGGRQRIAIAPNHKCSSQKSYIVHEMLHALGLYHEQSRPDRDKYVRINFGNIEEDGKTNFEISDDATAIGPYDFKSIMHYPDWAYSKNKKPSVESLTRGSRVPANIQLELSRCDISKIKYITGCTNTFEKCD